MSIDNQDSREFNLDWDDYKWDANARQNLGSDKDFALQYYRQDQQGDWVLLGETSAPQTGSQLPVEVLQINAIAGPFPARRRLKIVAKNGAAKASTNLGVRVIATPNEHVSLDVASASGSLGWGPSTCKDAIVVAALDATNEQPIALVPP